ncbi:MAG: NADP-dependent oxidoreductase [Alphaproteobacteria bacterium]|nr:NADP-dependent oxidoreductase [Alphaproteobacteria bacterium]
MRVIRYGKFGGPEVLELVEVPDPIPGPGEVVVDVHAASVNPVDWKIRTGAMERYFKTAFPVIPGRDGAGVVAALGPGVAAWKVGDAASFIAGHMGQGTYAEKIALKTDRLVAKPAALGFAEAAAYPLAGLTAWMALVATAPVEPGMAVLVHGGAGGVGGIAVQIARHRGARVIATASAANADYVRSLGAERVVAYDREDFARVLNGLDIVFDTMGGEVHRRSYGVLKKGGTLVWITAEPVTDLGADHGVAVKQAVVRDNPDAFRGLAQLVADGAIKPQVGRVLPLVQAAEAHRLSQTTHVRGKLVLDVP